MFFRYSTLFYLPPLRFHCVGDAGIESRIVGSNPKMLGSNPRMLESNPKDAVIELKMLLLNPRYRDRTQDAGIEPKMLGSNP
jgi:hypothetical protein